MIGSKVSKRYAKALFSIGLEDGSFEQYGRELNDFTRLCLKQRDFGNVISSRLFPLEDRKRVLESVLQKSGYSQVVKNFLFLLLEKDRMATLEAVADYYGKLTDEASNIARAEIVTAMPLKKDALANLEKSLEALTSKKIKSQIREDKSIIGGVVVKIGDLVLDGSVRAQLEGLRESF